MESKPVDQGSSASLQAEPGKKKEMRPRRDL